MLRLVKRVEYLTTEQAAAIVGVSGPRVKVIADNYDIEVTQKGRANFYNKEQLAAAMPAIRNRPRSGRLRNVDYSEQPIDFRDHDPKYWYLVCDALIYRKTIYPRSSLNCIYRRFKLLFS